MTDAIQMTDFSSDSHDHRENQSNQGPANYYDALTAKGNELLSSTLHAKITSIQSGSQGDFFYNYENPELLFNALTLVHALNVGIILARLNLIRQPFPKII